MRSRGATRASWRCVRDLIEAGLNEPADARAVLWILLFAGGSGHDLEALHVFADMFTAGNNPACVSARKRRFAWLRRAWWGPTPRPRLAWARVIVASISNVAAMPEWSIRAAKHAHDVLGHRRARAKVAVICKLPPQHGQTLGSKGCRCVRGLAGTAGSPGVSASRCRICASLARRMPLARKP